MNRYQEVEIKEIKVGVQPRKFFDEKKMEELTKSVKEKGILQPVLVRPNGKKFDLACGERRMRAAKTAGLSKIPCIVRKLTDAQIMEIQFVENLQREDLNPIEEAIGLEGLIKKCGYTQADVADRIGKSQAYIANRIRLLTLPEKVQEAISREIITPGHGLVILRLGDPKQQLEFSQALIKERQSIRQAEHELHRYGRYLSEAPFDKKECAQCPHNGTVQRDLFEKQSGFTSLKGRCMNKECFEKKLNQFISSKMAQLKKQGYKVMTAKSFRSKYGYSSDYEQLRGDYHESYKDLGEEYKKHCLAGCENLLFVVDTKEGKIAENCMNVNCFRALRRSVVGKRRQEERKEEGSASGTSSSADQEAIYQNRTREIKRRDWIKEISARTTSKVANVMMLYQLGHRAGPDWYTGKPMFALLKRLGVTTKKDTVSKIHNMNQDKIIARLYDAPEKKVEKEVVRIIFEEYIYGYESGTMDFLAMELGYDIRKDYIISKAYLNTRTKDQLAKLAKEIGLIKFLKGRKVGAMVNAGTKDAKVIVGSEKVANLKKGEIIDLFLKHGFDLKGKVPADIKKK